MNKDDVETFESMWHTIFADDDDDMEVELIKIEGTTVDGSRRWNRRPLMSNSNPCWQIVACGLSIVWYSEDLNLVMLQNYGQDYPWEDYLLITQELALALMA